MRAPVRAWIDAHRSGETLGRILPADQRRNIAQAYADPARAERELDAYCWEPPKSPAPFVGYVPAPGEHASAHIDARGFRTLHDVSGPKEPGTYRIFLVGGSTAFGVGAPSDGATVGALLERRLEAEVNVVGRRFEVVTAAAPAWASTHERILIENVIVELDPDLVVALSGVNDCHWGWRGENVMWFRTYAEEYFRGLLDRACELAGAPAEQDVVPLAGAPVDPGAVAYRFELNVRLASYALATHEVPYLLFLQPCLAVSRLSSREPGDDSEPYFVACYDAIRVRLAALKSQGLRFVDVSRSVDGDFAREHLYIDSYHFADKGNERLAAAMLDSIREIVAVR